MIIGIILVFVTVLTYIIPAGQYQRIEDADGQMVVLSDSFEFIEQTPVGPGGMVMAIVEGMVQSADIIFFIFFAYGLVYMLIETGAFFGGMGALIKKCAARNGSYFLCLWLCWEYADPHLGCMKRLMACSPCSLE